MITFKHSLTVATIIGGLLVAMPTLAQSTPTPAATDASKAASLTEGEVRKVDKDNKKLTIKHGDIKNLDMPGMTMVFQVKDPAMVDQVKVGDKIRFRVEKASSGFVVTELQSDGK